jgi:hypothetical protein
MRTRISRLAPLAIALLVAAFAAGCGREDPPDLVNGKKLFAGKGTCGSCHELARAGTKGQQGPSLDQAFAISRQNGLGKKTVEGVVLRQIEMPRRGSTMPANLVEGRTEGRPHRPRGGQRRQLEVLGEGEGRQLRVLLLGPRPRGRRHEGRTHRQVARVATSSLRAGGPGKAAIRAARAVTAPVPSL